ncbi:MAG: ATP-binding protein [Desulfotignum sp.]|nr:DNA polymerase III subunit [Desulfobacteraceae bacterium]
MPHTETVVLTAISELRRIIDSKKIPNALLFTGNPGAGRKQTAFWFAKAVNCASDSHPPCDLCRSCKKIDNRVHPDMILVDLPEKKKVITISQIREMEALTAVKPHEARYRMVLISHAEHMNTQAQNALLKGLEEPAQGTFFILTARDAAALLPTIRSRVRVLQFKPLTGAPLADHLCASFKADPRAAKIAAATAGSDLNLALTLLNIQNTPYPPGDNTLPDTSKPEMDWQAGRAWIMQQLFALISSPTAAKVQTALSLSCRISLDTDRVNPALAIMRTFFRDLCVFRHTPQKIVNLDFFDIFQDIGQQADDRQCLMWMSLLHETEHRLASNSSVRMTMDRFFLHMIQNMRNTTP